MHSRSVFYASLGTITLIMYVCMHAYMYYLPGFYTDAKLYCLLTQEHRFQQLAQGCNAVVFRLYSRSSDLSIASTIQYP